MLDKFETAYTFIKNNGRLEVNKFKTGNLKSRYFLLTDGSCSCPAVFKPSSKCKHRQMWDGEYDSEESAPFVLVQSFAEEIANSLNLPFTKEADCDSLLSSVKIQINKSKIPFELFIGEKKIAGKKIIIEIRRMNNGNSGSDNPY